MKFVNPFSFPSPSVRVSAGLETLRAKPLSDLISVILRERGKYLETRIYWRYITRAASQSDNWKVAGALHRELDRLGEPKPLVPRHLADRVAVCEVGAGFAHCATVLKYCSPWVALWASLM